jgi:hypothetical protein
LNDLKQEYQYDVAISFAEEDRNAALALALAFELAGVKRVYYYPDQPAATALGILKSKLKDIYQNQCRYTIILLSRKYFKKEIARAELEAIYERMMNDPQTECVIPVTLKDDLNLDKYPKLELLTRMRWDYNPKKLASILIEKLGSVRAEPFVKKEGGWRLIRQSNKAKKVKTQKNNISIH